MSHGTDVVEGRSADVSHLAIHGKVTVESNSTVTPRILILFLSTTLVSATLTVAMSV